MGQSRATVKTPELRLTSKSAKQTKLDMASVRQALGGSRGQTCGRLALEPRILLDAALVETTSETLAVSNSPAELGALLVRPGESQTEAAALFHEPTPRASTEQASEGESASPYADEMTGDVPDASGGIIFIDGNVDDIGTLITNADPDLRIYVLDPQQDGLAQIAAALEAIEPPSSVHIISHGGPGELALGNSVLTQQSISGEHAEELANIAASLQENADIFIYGCDFAHGEVGEQAVAALASATGADVAASSDLTGAAQLGGDWDLEVLVGTFESDALAFETYGSLLATDAQIVGGEAFVRGDLVEMGINANGTFGATTTNAPAGFHDPRVPLFGFIANPQDNNWASYDGDFFTPGTPLEGFAVEFNGTAFVNDTAGPNQIPGSITGVTPSDTLCGDPAASVDWGGSIGGLDIDRSYTIAEDGLFILMETTLTNTTGSTMSDVFWSHNVDPDNDQTIHGDFSTTNTIVSQPGATNDIAVVRAIQTQNDGSSVSLVADDPRARVSHGGFVNHDPSVIHAGTGLNSTVGSTVSADEAISLAFNLGDLAPGESVTFVYAYNLEIDPTNALACASAVGNPAPVINLDADNSGGGGDDGGFETTFSEGDAPVAIADVDLDVDDLGENDISTTTIVTGAVSDGNDEVVTIAGQSFPLGTDATVTGIAVGGSSVNISYVSATGTFTITDAAGAATALPAADVEALLAGITYENTSDAPTEGNRTLAISATDTSGNASTPVIATVDVSGVNDDPVLDLDGDDSSAPGSGFAATYTENDPAISIVDTDFVITDPEDNIVEMVITLTNGQIGDTLQFPSSLPGGITASLVPSATLTAAGPLTLTLTGNAATTVAQWESVLGSVTFLPSTNDVHNPDTTTRIINIQVSDTDVGMSNVATSTISIVAENDAPTLDLDDNNDSGVNANNANAPFTEGAGAVPLHSDITIADLDNPNLAGATVTLTNPFPGDEILIAGNPVAIGDSGTTNGISWSVSDGGSGEPVITFNTPAPVADYVAVLESIAFNNTSDNPDTTTREVEFVINDGTDSSSVQTTFVQVTAVNDPPLVHDPANPGIAVPDTIIADIALDDSEDVTGANAIDFGQYFFDLEGDTLTYSIPDLPAGLSVDPATGIVSGTVDASASVGGPANDGIYPVTISVFDGTDTTTVDVVFTASNPAPIANADTGTLGEDGTLSGDLINGGVGNPGDVADTDADGDPLSVTAIDNGLGPVPVPPSGNTVLGGTNGGTFTINSDGTYSFDPGTDFQNLDDGETATTSLTYTLSDADGASDSATITLTVTGANDGPVVIDPNDPFPNPNDPPVPVDPNDVIPDQSVGDGQAITPVDGSLYFTDVDGEALTYSLGPSAPPWLSIDPLSGVMTGTAPSDASVSGLGGTGNFAFDVIATDPDGLSASTELNLEAVNAAPIANDDALTGDEDNTLAGNVLTDNGSGADGDAAPDTDPVTVSAVNAVEGDLPPAGDLATVGVPVAGSNGGTFTIDANGDVTFDPGTDFQDLDGGESRTTSVSYQISDGQGGFDTATLTMTVDGANDGPVVIDPTDPFPNPNDPPVPADPNDVVPLQTGNDGEALTPLNGSDYFVDVDGEPLTYSLGPGAPPWVSIDPLTGIVTGTPPSDASIGGPASDGVYEITIIAEDPEGETASTSVDFEISNLPPVAVDDAATADEDAGLQVGNVLTDPVTGDSDTAPDSDPLVVSSALDGNANPITLGAPHTMPGGGTLTINPDGSWSFDPGDAYNGLDDGETELETVTYTIDDGNGGTDTAILTFTVTGSNDAPVIIDPGNPGTDPENPIPADPSTVIPVQTANDGDDFTVTPFVDVSDYAVDPDAETLTFTTTDPLPAGLTLNPDGTVTGTVDPAASTGGPLSDGVYPITVEVSDGTDTVTVTLNLEIENLAPIANDDALTGDEDNTLAGNVLADNGSGADGDAAPDTDPVTVSAVNAVEGDLPPAGDLATVGVPVSGSNGGTFTVDANGDVTFDPGTDFQDLDAGESRTTTISYQISDGQGGFDTATLTMTVDGANDGPVVIDPTDPFPNPNDPPVPADPNDVVPLQTGNDGEPLTPLNGSDYFVDVDGEPLTYSLGPGAPPWVSIDTLTGIVTGTPPSDASIGGPASDGVYEITIIATDPEGETASTSVDFEIENVPPVVVSEIGDQTETTGYDFELETAANFGDPDNDTLTYIATGLPGGLSIDPSTGLISGTIDPTAVVDAPNGDGVYSVTVTVDDNQGGTASSTFEFTVMSLPIIDISQPNDPLGDPDIELILQEDGLAGARLIVDGAVNRIAGLGTGVGIFDLDHPVSSAVNGIAPLGLQNAGLVSSSIGLDPHAWPVSEAVSWIETTRLQLDLWAKAVGINDPSAEGGLAENGNKPWSGSDARITDGDVALIARTLMVGDQIFVELIAEGNSTGPMLSDTSEITRQGGEVLGTNLLRFHLGSLTGPVEIGIEVNDGNRLVMTIDPATGEITATQTQAPVVFNTPTFQEQILNLAGPPRLFSSDS